MKRCPQCNAENADSMNFCLQCGAALPDQININLQNDPPPTQVYREPTTNPGGNRPTFANNQGFNPNYGQQQQPPPKKSNAKIFLILGGVFALFMLFVFAGVAIIAYNIYSSSKTIANNNPTYPTPVRTPFPSASTTPMVNPNTTPTTKSATDPNGKIDKTWVDYDVSEGGRTGMKIHNKFWTYNLKDTECYLAVYFQKEDGTRLTSTNSAFKAQNGDLALFKLLKPNYPNTVYDDIAMFMPYGEFNVTPGKYKLTMDVDLITKGGQMIQHLGYHNFEYERFAQ
jgi:zinc-ribbon domain